MVIVNINLIKMFPKQPGVYCFKNTINNKVYIGSAQCLYTRINSHLKARNSNQHLQNAINKYSIDLFCITYQVLETKEQALCLEQMLLDYIFKLNINCYNISLTATGGNTLSDYSSHHVICEASGGYKSKTRYALEVNNPSLICNFESSYKAAHFTKVSQAMVSRSCKDAKPYNSEFGRWLFSDISIEDLKAKFYNLSQAEIKGSNSYSKGFILINKITGKQSQVFYSVCEPIKQGYNINKGNLGSCLLGKLKSVNGYFVKECIGAI